MSLGVADRLLCNDEAVRRLLRGGRRRGKITEALPCEGAGANVAELCGTLVRAAGS